MTARRPRGLAAGIALAALTVSAPAASQSPGDAAAAEALFGEAQKLAAAGNYVEACPKYAESLRLDTGIGVMLYLADCWEHTGKTASAWAQFREAEQLATRQSDKRAATAHQRAALLEPNLARMVIRVQPGADVAGLEVTRDTTAVGRAQWGVPVPVDPGEHSVTVTAPGKKARRVPVSVPAGKAPTVVELLPLEDAEPSVPPPAPVIPAPTVPPEEPARPAVDTTDHTRRTMAWVAGGVGVVGLAIGSAFGFETISKNNASNTQGCSATTNLCNQNGLDLRNDAKSTGLVSTVAFAAGAVFVAGGVVLYLTAPRGSAPTTVGLAPVAGGRGGAALFSRSW